MKPTSQEEWDNLEQMCIAIIEDERKRDKLKRQQRRIATIQWVAIILSLAAIIISTFGLPMR